MSDSYKEDIRELKGQESTLEQKLKERHRIFQSSGDTRQVRKDPSAFALSQRATHAQSSYQNLTSFE